MPLSDVALITLNWRRYDLVEQLLDCAARHTPDLGLILVVDQECRSPGPAASLRRHALRPCVLPRPDNPGFAAGVNRGLRECIDRGFARFLVLNNDICFDHDFVTPLLELLASDGTALVGPLTINAKGVESFGVEVDPDSPYVVRHVEDLGEGPETRCVTAIQGSALAFSRQTLEKLGPLEDGYFYGWEETEWCLRARREGLQNVVTSRSRVFHLGSASLGGPDGYNPVIEFMLMRNMLYFLRSAGFGEPRVQAHIAFWQTHARSTSFRNPEAAPADPDLSETVICRAIEDFRAGRRGRWPEDIARMLPT